MEQFTGSDAWGYFNAFAFNWTTVDGQNDFRTVIRAYQDTPAISFEQIFVNGVQGSSLPNQDAVISGFPCFLIASPAETAHHLHASAQSVSAAATTQLGYVTWFDNMAEFNQVGQFSLNTSFLPLGLKNGGPFVIFDSSASNVVVFSSLSNFMAGSMQQLAEPSVAASATSLRAGLMGGIDSVPAGYSYSTVVYYGGAGVTRGMKAWGSALLQRYGTREDRAAGDFAARHLGYWTGRFLSAMHIMQLRAIRVFVLRMNLLCTVSYTPTDNGGYYYYNTEPGMTYEQTLIAVKQYSVQAGLPFRYLQLDSWWYYRGNASGS